MTLMNNLFADLPAHLPDELISTPLETADVRIEQIISLGHASPADFWYDQPQAEWVIVLKRAARLQRPSAFARITVANLENVGRTNWAIYLNDDHRLWCAKTPTV